MGHLFHGYWRCEIFLEGFFTQSSTHWVNLCKSGGHHFPEKAMNLVRQFWQTRKRIRLSWLLYHTMWGPQTWCERWFRFAPITSSLCAYHKPVRDIGVMFTNLDIERGPHIVWYPCLSTFMNKTVDSIIMAKSQYQTFIYSSHVYQLYPIVVCVP